MANPLNITAQSELDVVMTRVFEAPRPLVFDAWTKPELLCRWLGVRGGWTMPVCEIDLRVGGAYRYVWRSAEGAEMGVRGVYREVVAPARLVATERFDEAWYPGEALITQAFEERGGGRTLCTLTARYESTAARDAVLASPMEHGVAESYRVLDRLLESR